MNSIENNYLLKELKELFDIYCFHNDYTRKKYLIRLLYEKRLVDMKFIDIFTINNFLVKYKIIENEDIVTFKSFLNLVFFIYLNQIPNESNMQIFEECIDEEREFDKLLEISPYSNKKEMDNNSESFNIIKSIIKSSSLYEQTSDTYKICFPDFNNDDILELFENIDIISAFKDKLYNLFSSSSSLDETNETEYISFERVVEIIIERNVFNNFPSIRICDVLSKFMLPYKFNFMNEEFKLIFDDPKISKNKNLIEIQLAKFNLNINDLHFNFSSFVLLISIFHKYLKANCDKKSTKESLLYYYKVVLELDKENIYMEYSEKHKVDTKKINDLLTDFEGKDINYQDFPPSKILEEAIKAEENKDEDDDLMIKEFIIMMDKELPLVSIYDTSFKVNNLNTTIPKQNTQFPFNLLKAELEEEIERTTKEKEKQLIMNAKQKGNNQKKKDVPVKPLDYEIKKTNKDDELKYCGTSIIHDLKRRFFKNSLRQIIVNSNVYPCIINESLLIPNKIPNEIKLLIISAQKDLIKGDYPLALSQLERAQDECKDHMLLSDSQINLYFNLMFGSILENLNLFGKAMLFYHNAKVISTNSMSSGNPDIALVYCYIGSLMIKLNEPEFALRSYWKAKFLRETIIGGDALDTATVYNNLGVCFYYLNQFYQSHGFLKLAYELYKEFE